jgi:hypothetical protein
VGLSTLPNVSSLVSQRKTVSLRKRTAAIQVVSGSAGAKELGMCLHLPQGSVLEVCGEGFSDGTVQVRWSGSSYFVLLESVLS